MWSPNSSSSDQRSPPRCREHESRARHPLSVALSADTLPASRLNPTLAQAPLARRASSSGEVSSPAERADQKQLEPDPPARRVSRHSCTAVASAHSGPGGWPPLSRILPTVTSGNGFPPSPARPPNPTAPGRQLSMRRIPFARQDSIGHAGGPPAPPFPILPLSPRTADGGTTSGGPGPPPKRPSWPRSSDTSDVYKQEEATYRLTLSGPKLKSHRVRAWIAQAAPQGLRLSPEPDAPRPPLLPQEVHGDTLVMHVDSSGISHLFVRRILEPLGYKARRPMSPRSCLRSAPVGADEHAKRGLDSAPAASRSLRRSSQPRTGRR